jgi:hypothetical protein
MLAQIGRLATPNVHWRSKIVIMTTDSRLATGAAGNPTRIGPGWLGVELGRKKGGAGHGQEPKEQAVSHI